MKLHTLQILQFFWKMTFARSWSVVSGAVLCCVVMWCACVLRWLCVCDVCCGVCVVCCFLCVYMWCCVLFGLCVCAWCGGACGVVVSDVLCVVVWCLWCQVCCVCAVWWCVCVVCGAAWHAEPPPLPVCRFKTSPFVRSRRLRVFRVQHAGLLLVHTEKS